MHNTEIRQEVFTFAQAQSSAGDIDAMRIQRRIKADELDQRTEDLKKSAEWEDVQQIKSELKALDEQIAEATGQLVSGLVGK